MKISYIKLFLYDKRFMRFFIQESLVIVLFVWFYSKNLNEPIINWLYVLFLFILVFIFFFNNYFNYLKFFIFLNKLTMKNIPFKEGKCNVSVFQGKIKTTVLKNSQQLTINTSPRNVKCRYILTEHYFMLFCKVVYLGLFETDIAPVMIEFTKNGNEYLKVKKNRIIAFENTYLEGSSLIVPFFGKINDIEKLSIEAFKEIKQ